MGANPNRAVVRGTLAGVQPARLARGTLFRVSDSPVRASSGAVRRSTDERFDRTGAHDSVLVDRTLEDLPSGIDALGLRAVEDPRSPTALSALSAEVRSEHQRTGLSALVIATMATKARRVGLAPLVAPVRPSWKHRLPLNSVGDYASWQRRDGLPFDPWIRVHVRLGARILRPEPNSMEFIAQVSDWEDWTGMRFDRDGSYVFQVVWRP